MLIETFKPNEVVEINGLGIDTPRLVRFDDKGFCRYYMGLKEVVKPCEWAYFSLETLKLLEKYAKTRVSERVLRKYIERHGLLLPKYVRKVAWRLMIRAMPREVTRFVQSRFGELKVSEARYEDLLAEADEYYPKYLEQLNELIKAKHAN
jgi:intergrase/recombinase